MLRFYDFFLKTRSYQTTLRQIRTLTALFALFCCLTFFATYKTSSDQFSGSFNYPVRQGDICQSDLELVRLLLVLRVHAAYSETRTFVRLKVKNSTQCHLKVVFIYGKLIGDKSKQFQEIIDAEQAQYGDIKQFDSVMDYHLHGQRAVDVVIPWIGTNSCVAYHQVAFGTFQIAAETSYHAKHYGRGDANWALDNCLKFTLFKRTNIQFFAHYFPQIFSTDTSAQINQKFGQSGMFDYQERVVTPHDYPYLIQPSKERCICCDRTPKRIFAIIAVHSASNSSSNRMMIRSTWASEQILAKYNSELLFFLGRKEKQSKNDMAKLKYESDTYNDIIQEDFADSYKNMTLKQVSILKYLHEECSHVQYQYLFKTDDDVVSDLRSIRRYMDGVRRTSHGLPLRSLYCFHMNELAHVPRYADKWYVSPAEYVDDLYPAYCSGAAYLISKDLIGVLYHAALHVRWFWVDDTFISGILPQAVGNVSIIQIPKQSLENINVLRKYGDVGQLMIVHVYQDMELFQIYWDKFRWNK